MTSNNIKNYFSSTTNGLNGSKERIEESTSKKTKSSKFQTTKRNTEHKSKESKECGYKSKDDTIKQNMLEVLKAVEKKKKCSKKRRLKKIKEQRDGDPDKEISEILGKSIHFSPTKPRRLVDSEDEENEQKIANGTLEVEESSEPLSVVSEVPTVISDTSFIDSDQIALQIEVMAEKDTSITEKPKNAFQLMMQSRPAKTSPQMLDDSLLDEINSIKPSKRKSKSKKSNTPNNKIEINEKKEENEPETANLPSQSEVSTPVRRRGRPKKIQLNIVETNNNLQVISNGENLKNGTVQQEIKEKPTIPVSEQVMEVEANEIVELKNEDVVNTNNKRKISGAGELEPKKRKTKEVEEKLLETPPKTASLDDSVIWQSGRPRRTCTAKIPTWEELLTPEKKTPEKNEKVLRKKKEKPADCIEIDESSPEKNQQTRPKVKLAPLFVKQLPRPSIDPLVVEARKNFLLSGIPEVLKVEIDKQRKFEDEFLGNELVAYPLISHVNKYQGKSPEVSFKNSKIKLAPNLEECDQQTNRFKPLEFGLLTTSSMQEVDQILKQQEISYVPAEKINDMKGLLLDLKTEHDYFPVFRCYKQLKAKKLSNGLMVEKYKPNSFDEYLINYKPVKELQNFLMLWNSKDRKYDSDDSNSNSSHRLVFYCFFL